MNSNQKLVIALLSIIVLFLAGLVILRPNNLSTNLNDKTRQSTITSSNITETSVDSDRSVTVTIDPAKPPFFGNTAIRIRPVPGWHPYKVDKIPGAINITKGNYILFINPNFHQGSGVQGARFSEVAMGAPGVNLVIKIHPTGGCKTPSYSELHEKGHSTTNGWHQFNEYTASFGDTDVCRIPTDGKIHWYFSYFIKDTTEGYVTYKDLQHPENGSIVITLTIKANKVNNLPIKGSQELTQIFSEVRDMLQTLEVN